MFTMRRERKKKKLGAQDKDEKVDKSYMANVMMVACLILTFPYDMPTFLPALVTSFVKHKSTSAVQATVLKVIQNFKRTHQDRYVRISHTCIIPLMCFS